MRQEIHLEVILYMWTLKCLIPPTSAKFSQKRWQTSLSTDNTDWEYIHIIKALSAKKYIVESYMLISFFSLVVDQIMWERFPRAAIKSFSFASIFLYVTYQYSRSHIRKPTNIIKYLVLFICISYVILKSLKW